jgi:hypothetical protein
MSSDAAISQEEARYEYEYVKANRETRAKEHCEHCGDLVPDVDFGHKFAAAGGLLAGPFCSRDCYWGWMTDD